MIEIQLLLNHSYSNRVMCNIYPVHILAITILPIYLYVESCDCEKSIASWRL